MKNKILIIVLLCISFAAQATIINVDNNPTRPSGYYSNLQLAINTAQAGDTLYVYPSNTSYGDITVSKKLHLFGKGYSGSTSSGSMVSYLRLDTTTSPSSNPSGTTIQGFTITRSLSTSKPNITNIVVFGNYFTYGSSAIKMSSGCSSWLISNNYIRGYINLNYNSQIVISNNIFSGSYYYHYPISSSSSKSVVFSHNLVMDFQYFNAVSNAVVSDNIFICSGNANSTMANNLFYNNLSWRTTLNPYVLPPSGNTGANNVSNQDPQFETALSSGNFDYTKDYHLKSTSPGKNAASDGTDIGPYGGSNPFVWGGVFSIPKITETLITNPVINQSTPINVNVKAEKAKL